METKRMKPRIAGLMMSATLGCGVATAATNMATAQLFRGPDSDANPLQRLFGFSSSPVQRTLVGFPASYRPGTIVISTSGRRLYFVNARGEAISYGIGVGRIGFTWTGTHTVSMKREWPDWTPPAQMLQRRPDLPRHMVGGIENPLGARAIYLGSSLYRIHGSNEPETIGQAVSSGCFRMTNEDVIDLYNRVRVGATVVVLR
jgi:lipoprotein-anchoring transpeptidase ErfK/SrfK